MNAGLADIVVANIHRRYTGVSATVKALIPHQRQERPITLVDTGNLGFTDTLRYFDVMRRGWSLPCNGKTRIWHARRDVEIIAGLFLRDVLRQNWKVVFTSAAPKKPNRYLNALIDRVDAVIATSQRSADFLDWHSVVIPHGVDTEFFCPPADRSAAQRETGLPGRYAIGHFGRIRPSKGTDLFVDAMIALLPQHPDYSAIISGLCQKDDQDYLSEMQRRISQAGLQDRIVFVGDLAPEDIRRWYQRISLCVAASRSEGFGLTPLEAFASGCPAVTSRAGAWPWIVDNEVGALFETGSVDSLCASLAPLLATPEKLDEMGRTARRRAVERYSIQGESKAINAVYAGLIAGQSYDRVSA